MVSQEESAAQGGAILVSRGEGPRGRPALALLVTTRRQAAEPGYSRQDHPAMKEENVDYKEETDDDDDDDDDGHRSPRYEPPVELIFD